MRNKLKAVIIGAGPCGLTAAWEFLRLGADVTVVEKDEAIGGLCKTVRRDGFQFDLGGHRFISADRALVDGIRSLMGDRLLVRERRSVIRFSDAEYEYPINVKNILRRSSPWISAKFAAGYFAYASGLLRSPAPEKSFEGWIDKRFGRPLNEFFFRPYTEKLWGVPASSLSADWAGQRISLLDAKDAVLKSLKLARRKPRTYATKYLYPMGGIGEIFEVMAEEIKRLGGTIITGASLSGFAHENGRVRAARLDGGRAEVEGDVFISTMPLDKLAAMIEPGAPALPYRALRFLNVTLDGIEDLSPNTWMYTPEPNIIMTRIQEPRRRSPESAPSGRTSVMLEIPCDVGDAVWSMPDEKLLGRVIKDMKKLGFDIEPYIDDFFCTRAEYAYPRYEIGYQKRVDALRKIAGGMDNLITIGRQGLFRYIFMDSAMIMGRDTARKIMGASRREGADEISGKAEVIEANSVAA